MTKQHFFVVIYTHRAIQLVKVFRLKCIGMLRKFKVKFALLMFTVSFSIALRYPVGKIVEKAVCRSVFRQHSTVF